jgi:protein arginine kinase
LPRLARLSNLGRPTLSVKSLDPRKFAERLPHWLIPSGNDCDVVISCRVRLARNVAGFPFVTKLTAEQAPELAERLRPVLTGAGVARVAAQDHGELGSEMVWVEVEQASPLLRHLLRERHLVSRDLAPTPDERVALPGRAVAFSRSETLSIMVNEEDHLRLQTMAPGFHLAQAWERAQALDRVLEQSVDTAFDSQVGYLTCCPTNVGTGLRASVMLHLPALGLVRSEIEKVFAAAQRTGLAVRGLYGEGSRAFGDFYQISNQVTLGRSEDQLIGELGDLVPAVVRFERNLRESLLSERREALVDRISRSWGLLRTARAMPTDGALAHLSNLRMGAYLGLWEAQPPEALARARVQIQKGHVQALSQAEPASELVEPSERDRLRAAFLRKALAER